MSISAEVYRQLITERADNHCPVPPAHHFKHAGHHWLAYRNPASGGGVTSEIMVAQWNPVNRLWYHSNTIATTQPPIGGDGLLRHWGWVAPVPVPENI